MTILIALDRNIVPFRLQLHRSHPFIFRFQLLCFGFTIFGVPEATFWRAFHANGELVEQNDDLKRRLSASEAMFTELTRPIE